MARDCLRRPRVAFFNPYQGLCTMDFRLHPNLAQKSWVSDLPLCRVLLEDVAAYPWLMLVPRVPQAARLMDLGPAQQQQCWQELDLVQRVLWQLYQPSQLNVAAIGNKTPQLHVHVIARFEHDPAWPGTVWDHPHKEPYPAERKLSILVELATALSQV